MTTIEIDVDSVEEERKFFKSFFKFSLMMTIGFILFAYLTESAEPAMMAIFPGILTVGSIYMRDSVVRLLKKHFINYKKTNSGRQTGNASHLFFMFKADRKQH